MRTTLLGTHVTLLSCAVALLAANARAQDAAPPPDAPPPAAEPAPAAPPPPAPQAAQSIPVPPPPPTEAAPAPPPPPAAEATTIPAWFRVDSDASTIQLWAGATHPLGEGIGLATDIYVLDGGGTAALGEFDIGPAIAAGPFTLTPMLGYQVNWSAKTSQAIVPQLYFTGGPDPIYMEFWAQLYLNSVFNEGANNDLYTRLFINYKVSDFFQIGPEIEPTFFVNDAGGRESGLGGFVLGGDVLLSNYGKGSSIQLFLGYETKKSARIAPDEDLPDDRTAGLAGRFTFVHNF